MLHWWNLKPPINNLIQKTSRSIIWKQKGYFMCSEFRLENAMISLAKDQLKFAERVHIFYS